MGCSETLSDDPLTPAGRLFLQPQTDVVIHCIIRAKNPMDINAIKSTLKSSLMVQHPRFCSLLVRDKTGFEHWRRTQVNIDQHVIVFNNRLNKSGNFLDDSQTFSGEEGDDGDDEAAVNQYVADLSVSCPLNTSKPLWEIHVLLAHQCVVFRIHHSLGDGISLMSMLMASCRRADDTAALPRMAPEKSTAKGKKGKDLFWSFGVLWRFLKMVWFSLWFVMEFVVRSLFVCDRKTAIIGGDGVELWPRKLATAKFLLKDMKLVKNAIPNTTINDVLFGVVSSGLSRYLNHRTPNALHEGLRMTGVAMVNLRTQPGIQDVNKLMEGNTGARWGNKFGIVLLPVYYHKDKASNNSLEYLKRAKVMVDRKKLSMEAYFSYKLGDLVMSLLGAKYACLLNYRLLCNTTFTISNIMGPLDEITLADNPVSSIKVNTSSLPQALTMHMLSYAGMAEMQILVAKDIIPDPEFLAKCFEDALLEMKEAAQEINRA